MPPLRLLALDAAALPHDHAALARVIDESGAEVAVVHGAPHLLRWRSTCAALARRAGRVVVSGGRSGGANLIVSTLGVDVRATTDVRTSGGSVLRPSGATVAALRWRGADLVVAATHVEGNAADRLAQTGQVQGAIAGVVPDSPPSIVSAQGADRPGTSSWQALLAGRAAVGELPLFVDTRVAVQAERVEPGLTLVSLTLP